MKTVAHVTSGLIIICVALIVKSHVDYVPDPDQLFQPGIADRKFVTIISGLLLALALILAFSFRCPKKSVK